MADLNLKARVQELNELMENVPEVLKKIDSEYWVMESLMELLDMCAEYNQREFPDLTLDRFYPCTKVVKLNRSIPLGYLDRWKFDYHFMSGVFVALEGVLISPIVMETYFRMTDYERYRPYKLLDPVADLGAPADIEWSTIQVLSNGYGFALKKSKLTPEFLSYSSSYDFFEFV